MPSEAQISAGNYQKGHAHVLGMRISIESPAGSTRSGTADDGTTWSNEMQHDYGYIRGTTGRDKDHLDVFLGPDHKNGDLPVHVVDQTKPDGSFDEHKIMLGFPDASSAMDAYRANYHDDWDGLGAVRAMPLGEFKDWAFNDGRRVKPAQQLKRGGTVQNFAAGGLVMTAPADLIGNAAGPAPATPAAPTPAQAAAAPASTPAAAWTAPTLSLSALQSAYGSDPNTNAMGIRNADLGGWVLNDDPGSGVRSGAEALGLGKYVPPAEIGMGDSTMNTNVGWNGQQGNISAMAAQLGLDPSTFQRTPATAAAAGDPIGYDGDENPIYAGGSSGTDYDALYKAIGDKTKDLYQISGEVHGQPQNHMSQTYVNQGGTLVPVGAGTPWDYHSQSEFSQVAPVIAAMGLAAFGGPAMLSSALGGGVAGAAGSGAIIGGGLSALGGGNIGKGALLGALGGGIGSGISGALPTGTPDWLQSLIPKATSAAVTGALSGQGSGSAVGKVLTNPLSYAGR